MADAHKNFAYSTVLTAPSPDDSGTTLVVQSGDGTKFPATPFNATVWPSAAQPTSSTAEIVRVTGIATDTLTITRAQESTTAKHVAVGWQIAASITNKTLTDIENNYAGTALPYYLQVGSAVATYVSTSASATGSILMMPIDLLYPVKFNQLLLPVSLGYVTSGMSTTSASNTYYSYFGLYSLASNTIFSQITSNSFSIAETVNSVSLSWNFPTTTHTSGYGYGSLNTGISTTAQRSSYIDGSRVVGLQFGTEMSLSGGYYWLGLMQLRSTGIASTFGLSNAGIIGQIVNDANAIGSVRGLNAFGVPVADWGNKTTTNTAWFGRYMMGIVTNTTLANFGGSKLPNNITLSAMGAFGTTVTILPTITLVST